MSQLIWINEKTKEILHPEVLKLLDSFIALNDKEMLFVCLYTDYNSIYKQFPDQERKRRAMWDAFEDNELELVETKRIKAAIQDYMSLQYNPKIELINRYQQKIDKQLLILEADDTPSGIKKITDAINSLRENIISLQNEVSEETKREGVVKGNRELSFLEKLMSNKKQYLAVIEKRQ